MIADVTGWGKKEATIVGRLFLACQLRPLGVFYTWPPVAGTSRKNRSCSFWL
jgi:hypothetical protein